MSNPQPRKERTADGHLELPLWPEFFDWFFGEPRIPKTQQEWAVQHDLHPDTITRWKRDPDFRDLWERRAREQNISVERVQGVVDSLYASAKQGDVKAASLFLQYIDKFTPKKAIVVESPSTAALSDDDLVRQIREELES